MCSSVRVVFCVLFNGDYNSGNLQRQFETYDAIREQ